MPYALGDKSLIALEGVHPELVRVVKRAIGYSKQDFSVYEGLRTQERQNEYLKRKVTKVKFSKHMVQADGFGHAVDLVPWIDGQLRWEWGAIYPIAAAMRDAAVTERVVLRWGGVWDREISSLFSNAKAMQLSVADYCARHPGPDFIDGPHFELIR